MSRIKNGERPAAPGSPGRTLPATLGRPKVLNPEIGAVFGRLTVVSGELRHDGKRAVECECACGGRVVVLIYNLFSGNSSSCGCLGREKRAEGQRRSSKVKANMAYLTELKRGRKRLGNDFAEQDDDERCSVHLSSTGVPLSFDDHERTPDCVTGVTARAGSVADIQLGGRAPKQPRPVDRRLKNYRRIAAGRLLE